MTGIQILRGTNVVGAWYDQVPWLPIGIVYISSTVVVIGIMWSGIRARRADPKEKPASRPKRRDRQKR